MSIGIEITLKTIVSAVVAVGLVALDHYVLEWGWAWWVWTITACVLIYGGWLIIANFEEWT